MSGGSGWGHADIMFIRGHMCSCLAFWERELCAPPWVLDTVKSGYVLLFYSLPTPYTRSVQHSSNFLLFAADLQVHNTAD